MPLYDYRCRTCGVETEIYRGVNENTHPEHCGETMEQFHLRAPMGAVQAETHYMCPATEKPITSRKQRLESFKRHNLADMSDLSSAKQYEREKKKWDKIRKTAGEAVNTLPPGFNEAEYLPPC